MMTISMLEWVVLYRFLETVMESHEKLKALHPIIPPEKLETIMVLDGLREKLGAFIDENVDDDVEDFTTVGPMQ